MIALFVRDIMFLRMEKLRTNYVTPPNYGTGSDTETELYPMMKYHAMAASPKTGADTMLSIAAMTEGYIIALSVQNIPATICVNVSLLHYHLPQSAGKFARTKNTGS